MIRHDGESVQPVVLEDLSIELDRLHDHIRDRRSSEVEMAVPGLVEKPVHLGKRLAGRHDGLIEATVGRQTLAKAPGDKQRLPEFVNVRQMPPVEGHDKVVRLRPSNSPRMLPEPLPASFHTDAPIPPVPARGPAAVQGDRPTGTCSVWTRLRTAIRNPLPTSFASARYRFDTRIHGTAASSTHLTSSRYRTSTHMIRSSTTSRMSQPFCGISSTLR